ncbi:MAG TPA: DegT/DnrJ/EryC1/StrS family aminotransferase [Chthonomonadaceae bacterium]|nr:DegT/DnrJ/EryC1/StrS family aminotransferase [Chthonomonadaceae bacterium]
MSQTLKISTPERPAIAGGEKAKRTPYGSEKRYGEAELNELREALEQGTLFYAYGKKTYQLETEFAAWTGSKYAVACNSGTSAIHAACIAIGLSPGDEVITSPITDMGTLVPILYQGAIPVFADLTPHGYTLDPASVASRITPRTRAIIAVHLHGNACDLAALRALCGRHALALIEDCAQSLGATYQKPNTDSPRSVGTFGDLGCFSLNEFKHISCGDGGMVVTDEPELARRARLGTDKCYDRMPGIGVRRPEFLANNYRMTELQAAVALAQLRKLDDIVARRRAWCAGLSARLEGTPGIALPEPTPACSPSWWAYMLRVTPELGADADAMAAALKAEGTRFAAHYIGVPVYSYPIFRAHRAFERGSHPYEAHDYAASSCPVAEAILETGLMHSVNEAFTETDADEVALAVRRAAAWLRAAGGPEH